MKLYIVLDKYNNLLLPVSLVVVIMIIIVIVIIDSLRNDIGDGNENGKNAIGLDKQNNNFARASHFFVHFSLSLHDYDVKLPNFMFWRGQEQKTTTFSFFS